MNIESTMLWHGYRMKTFLFEDKPAILVYPQESHYGLAIKTEYWDAFPEAIEIPLLERGFHLCYIQNENRFGTEPDIDRKARFLRYLKESHDIPGRCVPIGMSCGGIFAIHLAAKYPELIGCLYLDAPVVNFLSWPCGFGEGVGTNDNCEEILHALNLQSVHELLGLRNMPLDRIPDLVKNRIPVCMVYGDSDQDVPYCENGQFVERAYKSADPELEIYAKAGCHHHPHGMKNPTPIAAFIAKHCAE